MRVKAVIEYVGAAYAGWQVQPTQPTVQSALEKAIEVATGARTRVEGAGRTDSGVHAEGQVAAFDLADGTDLYRLRASLNGLTPPDIAVVDLAEAAEGFDPRRDATSRTYRYTIVSGRVRSPLLEGHCWHVYPELELETLERLAAAVVGRHDFSAFRASDCGSETTVRDVTSSGWTVHDHVYTYEVSANAFLKHMVRVIVGSIVDVALGTLDESVFLGLLEGGDRTRAGRTAPPEGLVLVRVDY